MMRLYCYCTKRLLSCRNDYHIVKRYAAVAPNFEKRWSTESLMKQTPRKIQPFLRLMRFDRPTGIWLLYWPCAWSIALAAPPGCLPNFEMLMLFGAGSFLMRSAGCVINDIFDKEYDGKVQRTRLRPLVSGELTNKDAVALLAVLLSGSLAILLQLSWLSVAVGASSLSLVLAYPFAKRYTYWPQFFLGITSNCGVLIAWSHLAPNALAAAAPLYLAAVLYTAIYDTIYSHQDKADDILVGVKSTALKFGKHTKYWLTAFAASALACFASSGVMLGQAWPFYCALGATGTQLAWQISTVDISNPEDCWRKFKTNQWLGVILFSGIVAGNLLREDHDEQQEA